jgi:hypothetical protein
MPLDLATIGGKILEIVLSTWEKLKPKLRVLAAFTALLLAISIITCWLILIYFGPVLLQARWEPITFRFPILQEFLNIPARSADKLQVLIQRKVVFINRWGIAAQPERECKKKENVRACDQTHVFDSWTVILDPDSPDTELKTTTGLDEYGAYLSTPQILTGQRRTVDNPDPVVQEWRITPTYHRPWTTDLIILKRDIVGSFQPSISKSPLAPPGLDPCKHQYVGFSLQNSVGTAELMVTTSPEAPAFKFGSTFLYLQVGSARPQIISENEVGEAKIFDNHNIYWYIKPDFLKKMVTKGQNARLVLMWEWDPKITSGLLCGSR